MFYDMEKIDHGFIAEIAEPMDAMPGDPTKPGFREKIS